MDDVISRVERALWPSDEAVVIVKCGDLRELISLARGDKDALSDGRTIDTFHCGTHGVSRGTECRLKDSGECKSIFDGIALDRLSPNLEGEK